MAEVEIRTPSGVRMAVDGLLAERVDLSRLRRSTGGRASIGAPGSA
jgi:hypothetical protein